MWLYRTFACGADQNRQPTDLEGLPAWEFRSAGDRQRYRVRQRRATLAASWPANPPCLAPLKDDPRQWHAYMGS
jgi:hypothetical protein